MEFKKIIQIIIIVILLLVIGLWTYYTFFTPWCLDDSGPRQYFYKNDLIDANIPYDNEMPKTREQELTVINFLKNNTPIAIEDSYCGTGQYYKILKNNTLTTVSEDEFRTYLTEQTNIEEVYSIQATAGIYLITKFQRN
jgi:hypothetical protein